MKTVKTHQSATQKTVHAAQDGVLRGKGRSARPAPIRIPGEIESRAADVAFDLNASYWHKLTPEQQAWVRQEAEHLIDLIQRGGNWYDNDAAGKRAAARDLRQAQAFLKAIGPAPDTGTRTPEPGPDMTALLDQLAQNPRAFRLMNLETGTAWAFTQRDGKLVPVREVCPK